MCNRDERMKNKRRDLKDDKKQDKEKVGINMIDN